MNQKREIRTVSLIGLGAIGCFLSSHLGPLMEDNLRVIAGGSRRERLEQDKPKMEKLKILADYFGVSIEYFLE